MNHKAARVGVSSLLISLLLLLLGCASKTPEQAHNDRMSWGIEDYERQTRLEVLEQIDAQIAELERKKQQIEAEL